MRTSSTSGYWQCVCSGKNGLQLNEDYRGPNEVVKLQHRDRLQIGDAIFFFLEPFTMSTTLVNTRIQA